MTDETKGLFYFCACVCSVILFVTAIYRVNSIAVPDSDIICIDNRPGARRAPLLNSVENVYAARALIVAGCDVNAADADGYTPLHMAAMRPYDSYAPLVELFIQNGADINARENIFGVTPLHIASNVPAARLLLAAGADINARDAQGDTPLCIARYVQEHTVAGYLHGRGGVCEK